ncbi:MAG: hypothetical protein ABW076_06325 [Candidatus Thiodiazotropha sp.]
MTQSVLNQIKADAIANSTYTNNILFTLVKSILHPGMQMLFLYRIEKKIRNIKYLGMVLGRILRSVSVVLTGCHISPEADIKEGIIIPHANGIVIGERTIIEVGVCIYQQVTIGVTDRKSSSYPIINEGAILYAGSKIIGGVVIGKHAVIGTNAVVTKSIPDNSVAVGVPARVL